MKIMSTNPKNCIIQTCFFMIYLFFLPSIPNFCDLCDIIFGLVFLVFFSNFSTLRACASYCQFTVTVVVPVPLQEAEGLAVLVAAPAARKVAAPAGCQLVPSNHSIIPL